MKKTDNPKYNSKMVRNTRNLISVIFLSLVSILALSTCIALILNNASIRRQAEASQSELDALETAGYYTTAKATQLIERAEAKGRKEEGEQIRETFREKLEQGDRLSAIRSLYPDEIVTDYSGQYWFTSINRELPTSPVADEELVFDDDGTLTYVGENTDLVIKKGIDISRSQGPVDFEKVKAAGVDFVMIRAGLRGSAEGQILEDDYFESNIKQALKAELEVGVYFYSQAINAQEAMEEADFLLERIENYNITFPVAINLDQTNSGESRTAKLTRDIYTEIASAFCDRVAAAGYDAMVFGNIRTFAQLIDESYIGKYPVWIIYHNFPQYFPYEYTMWQYARNGRIDGIDGEVNLDIYISGK